MALVIDLKPNEKILVGNTMITNDKQRTRLHIEGDAPILREKNTMTADQATTPAKKLYFILQSVYLLPADRAMERFDDYFSHLENMTLIAPQISDFLDEISKNLIQGTYYKGMKLVQDLINNEENNETPTPPIKKKSDTTAMSQNVMEAQLLNQSAEQLQSLYDQWETTPNEDKESIISYNRKLWMVFFDGVNENHDQRVTLKNPESFDLQNNIINLYNFIFKRSSDVVKSDDRDKLKTLIAINVQTANALRDA